MSKQELKPVEINLETLLKLIPDFDTAEPAQVYRYIRSCDSAFKIASIPQQSILLTFALNKIIGSGASDVHTRQFPLWDNLKAYLIQKFSLTKTLAHLQLELQSMFQKPNESITEYYLRVDLCRSKIQEKLATEISDNTLEGRKTTTEETALNVFINGISSDIVTMLRVNSFDDLSNAASFAIQEEKIRNTNSARQRLYKQSVIPQTTTEPRKPFRFAIQTQRPQQSAPQPQTYSKFCNYCKNPGHEIAECRKRAFNNRLKDTNTRTFQNRTPLQPRAIMPPPAHVNHLNTQATEEASMSSEIASAHCSTVPTQTSAIQCLETELNNLQIQ